MGIASEALRENGMQEQAKEMRSRIFQCQSYDSALSIIGDYVNITNANRKESMDIQILWGRYGIREETITAFLRSAEDLSPTYAFSGRTPYHNHIGSELQKLTRR